MSVAAAATTAVCHDAATDRTVLVIDCDPDWLARSLGAFAGAGFYAITSGAAVEWVVRSIREDRVAVLVLGPSLPVAIRDVLLDAISEHGVANSVVGVSLVASEAVRSR